MHITFVAAAEYVCFHIVIVSFETVVGIFSCIISLMDSVYICVSVFRFDSSSLLGVIDDMLSRDMMQLNTMVITCSMSLLFLSLSASGCLRRLKYDMLRKNKFQC